MRFHGVEIRLEIDNVERLQAVSLYVGLTSMGRFFSRLRQHQAVYNLVQCSVKNKVTAGYGRRDIGIRVRLKCPTMNIAIAEKQLNIL